MRRGWGGERVGMWGNGWGCVDGGLGTIPDHFLATMGRTPIEHKKKRTKHEKEVRVTDETRKYRWHIEYDYINTCKTRRVYQHSCVTRRIHVLYNDMVSYKRDVYISR